MNTETKKLISIIVPVFNEEENVPVFHERMSAVLSGLSDMYDFEMIFTDNHSTDGTFALLEALSKRDPRVRAIRFSRNFGYQRSIHTGYFNANGAAAVQLDVDLQDPPEMVADFLKLWEEGYKVVYGIRKSRKESRLISMLRKVFYRLVDFLSEVDLPHDAGDFRLVDRCVIEELKKCNDAQPYLRGAIASIGFKQVGVPYDRPARERGTSKFSFMELVNLALDGIVNHSTVPLRLATYTGLSVSAITILGVIVSIIGKIVRKGDWPAGFATTTIIILLSLSLNALFLGIIGEYLGRIYKQVKKSSLTIIERDTGAKDPD